MTAWRDRVKTHRADWHPATRQLSDYLDDDLPARQHREVDAHLAGCLACSTTLAELRRVVEHGERLNAPSEPAADLWPGIKARLSRRPASVPSWRSSLWPLLPGYRPAAGPALAAAVILVLACAATVAWLLWGVPGTGTGPGRFPGQTVGMPMSAADQQYAHTLAGLRRTVYGRLTGDPRLLDVIEENLATIDVAITHYREALDRVPADVDLQRRMAAAQQRKIAVLRQAVTATAGGTN